MTRLPFRPMLAIGACFLFVGCASNSSEIAASYVSPMTYQNYSCDQLIAENTRLQTRLSQVAGNVDKKAQGDKVKMGVGLVLFWPALFFLKGDGAEAQEYARLKGEHEAFDAAYTQKNCAAMSAGGSVPQSVPTANDVAQMPSSSYQGSGANAAKVELAKFQCFDNFSVVSERSGKGVYEATCKGGKRQLVECSSGACRPLN